MSEADAIAARGEPNTVVSVADHLRGLGVGAGDVVLMHSSMSSLGWVAGGPVAVIEAALGVLGPSGTLVMPAFSGDYSDPSHWSNPPVPTEWWELVREHWPAFDPAKTPTRGLGAIAECFRRWPGAVRSSHPVVSFTAFGPRAHEICDDHPLDHALGEGSPLARLYELDARVVLLGVGWNRCTSLHLAEVRSGWTVGREIAQGGPVLIDGVRTWVTYVEDDGEDADFPTVGSAIEATGAVTIGRVGGADARLVPVRAVVDTASAWFAENR